MRLKGIGLGCSREYLLEPGQLQVVNVVKTVVHGANHRIQGACVPIAPSMATATEHTYCCS